MNLTFSPYQHSRFTDLMGLLSSDRVSKDCRCLNHRVEPRSLELDQLAENKMKRFSELRKVHGLIAYDGAQPIAWIGTEPVPSLIGHDVYESLLDNKLGYKIMDAHWAIHCVFVKSLYRSKGLPQKLIFKAFEYATQRGATQVLGFAAPTDKYLELPCHQRFSGSEKFYSEAGFQKIGDLGPSYTLMLREVSEPNRGLRLA